MIADGLLGGLLLAALFDAYHSWRGRRDLSISRSDLLTLKHEHAAHARQMACVIDLLMIWAQKWGQDPDVVRVSLQTRVDRFSEEEMRYANSHDA